MVKAVVSRRVTRGPVLGPGEGRWELTTARPPAPAYIRGRLPPHRAPTGEGPGHDMGPEGRGGHAVGDLRDPLTGETRVSH